MRCCHFTPVIPTTFDDTLSYYEILCKVITKVNELVDAVNALQKQVDEMKGIVSYENSKSLMEVDT